MRIRFEDPKLHRLAHDATFTGGFDAALVKSFRLRVQQILAAPDERSFYALKSLHYEKLSGNYGGLRSMRLNRQWRLLLRIEQDDDGRQVVLLSIVDYH